MDWTIHHTILLSALGAGGIVGFVAARSHFCTMGAISDWINIGDLSRLRSWFVAIAVAILGTMTLEATQGLDLDSDTFPPYRSSELIWLRHVLGGLLFGVGMTLAGGCANKNVIRLGGGNLKSLLVLAIIAVTAYYLNWLGGYDTLFYPWLAATAISLDGPQELARVVTGSDSPLAHYVIGLLLAVALLLFAFRDAAFRASRQHVRAGIVIGLVVTFLWWLTGSETTGGAWRDFADFADEQLSRVNTQSMTFIAPLGDLAYYLQAPSAWNRLNVGILVLVGVTLGSFVHALVTRSFRIEWFVDRSDLLNHLVGAFLMGVGGILAMGCTFGQGITGISTLAVGSFLSLVSIVAGSALTMKWLYWRMMRDL